VSGSVQFRPEQISTVTASVLEQWQTDCTITNRCCIGYSSSRDQAVVVEAGRQHLPLQPTVTLVARQTTAMLVAPMYVGRYLHTGLLQPVEPRHRARRRG